MFDTELTEDELHSGYKSKDCFHSATQTTDTKWNGIFAVPNDEEVRLVAEHEPQTQFLLRRGESGWLLTVVTNSKPDFHPEETIDVATAAEVHRVKKRVVTVSGLATQTVSTEIS